MPHFLFIIFFFLLGACVGSFLNVVVWRLPRGESLVSPPSRCPVCEHRLAWYDNLPVVGWLKLRGRCRYCRTPISAQYPTIEFITGALFVLYYVMYFILRQGPCWVSIRPDIFGDLRPHFRHLTSIVDDWPQYLLAAFTLSALLAASLIDARQFWIPQSIPILLAVIGLLYHTILDRPGQPGSLSVQSGQSGALALGGGIGLLISAGLTHLGKLPRSFAQGWPALEIENQPHDAAQPEGRLSHLVRRWIDAIRPKLTAAQQRTLEQHQAAAARRDKAEEDRLKAEAAKQPKSEPRAFTRADINREIRKEMLFLMPPILLGILAFWLAGVTKIGGQWNALVLGHHWLGGFLGALMGALVGGFVVWLTRILGSLAFGREAMGMGDVDLMFGVGAVIGAGAATVAFFAAPFFGLALAIYMFVVGKRRELPYGPYLSLGTAFVMIYYCPIAEYLRPGMTTLAQIIHQRFGH